MSGWVSNIGGNGAKLVAPVILTDITRYTVGATDETIISNATSDLTLILPNATTCAGRILHVVACTLAGIVSHDANVYPLGVIVLMNSGIIPANNQGKWVTLQSTGVGWATVAAG